MTKPEPHAEILTGLIASGRATIGVAGLGYVGLPLALAALEAGFGVVGFDINAERVAAINQSRRVISYIGPEIMSAARASGRFEATTDFARMAKPDVLIICVPTPINRNREPDLSFVTATAAAIGKTLRPGQLVVLESTTWPGTTREVVEPILAASGLVVGEQVFLAFSPEREDPGNLNFSTRTIPKVVGADDAQSLDLAVRLYERLVARVVPVSSSATAEATKLTENIFRSVNIALVNELKQVYAAMGVDVWEVVDAAATKPFGYMPFWPGPGLGGHCIPVDPFYLTWKAREFGLETRFIELAGQINTNMPRVVVDRLAEALDRRASRGMNGARILLIGAAYKPNVDDIRESPSLVLMELVEHRGAVCDFHDPHVPAIPLTREHAGLAGRQSAPLTEETVASYDAVLISTDHKAVDYSMIAQRARLIIDTRNVFARLGLAADTIVKA